MSNPMEDIMNGIVAASKRDREQNSVVYRDLTAVASDDRQAIFDTYDLAATDASIAMSDVIKEKYGIQRMSDDLYWFIREFPVRLDKLSKEIERTEGHVCCVDKAWSRLMTEFDQLVKESL